jgi:hypothetical protein
MTQSVRSEGSERIAKLIARAPCVRAETPEWNGR